MIRGASFLTVVYVIVCGLIPFHYCQTIITSTSKLNEAADKQFYSKVNNPVERIKRWTYKGIQNEELLHPNSIPSEAKIQDIIDDIIANYKNIEKEFKNLKEPLSENSELGETTYLSPEIQLNIPEHDLSDLESFFSNQSNREGRFFKFNVKKNEECRRRALALEYLLFSFSGRISALAGTVGSLSNNINNVLTQQGSVAISNSNVQGPISNTNTATATNTINASNSVSETETDTNTNTNTNG